MIRWWPMVGKATWSGPVIICGQDSCALVSTQAFNLPSVDAHGTLVPTAMVTRDAPDPDCSEEGLPAMDTCREPETNVICTSIPLQFGGAYHHIITNPRSFPAGSLTKNLCQDWVRALGWEDPLEEKMASHCSGKSHGQRSLVGYSARRRKESDTTEWLGTHEQPTLLWLIQHKHE